VEAQGDEVREVPGGRGRQGEHPERGQVRKVRRTERRHGEELVAAWLEAGRTRGVTKHGKWKIQTYLSHETQYNYIAPKLGEIKASKLRKSQIEQAAAEWKEARSSAVANVLLSTLGAAFKWALRDPDRFGVRMNPLDTVERFAREERPEEVDGEMIADYGEDQLRAKPGTLREVQPHEVLSKLELRKIIEAAAPGMERTLLMVAILCGLRHGEIAGLRWSVIDFKRRTLTVNRSLTQLSKKRGGARLEAPKRKKSVREIELPAALVAELRQWKLRCPPNPLNLVFVNSLGKPTCRQDKRDRLKAVCKRAGVKPVTMHSLRHSYASQQLLNGTDPVEVSGLMGHSSPMTTLTIYAHWIRKEKSRAQERLATGIMGAVEESEEASSQTV
jgi:integrase